MFDRENHIEIRAKWRRGPYNNRSCGVAIMVHKSVWQKSTAAHLCATNHTGHHREGNGSKGEGRRERVVGLRSVPSTEGKSADYNRNIADKVMSWLQQIIARQPT